MAFLLYAPDPTFTGVCAGVAFQDGVGICDSEFMAGWLCAKGFAIDPDALDSSPADLLSTAIPEDLNELSADELVELAHSLSIPLTGIRRGDKAALMAAIQTATGK